jgi:hypothetical protein
MSQSGMTRRRRSKEEVVLPDRIELSTSPLPRECSTTELRQRWTLGKKSARKSRYRRRFLPQAPRWRKRGQIQVRPGSRFFITAAEI